MTAFPRRLDRRWLLAGAAALAFAPAARAAQPDEDAATGPASIAPQPIEVTARPIAGFSRHEASQTLFGDLEFVGGLVLTSSYRGFGGLSALRLDSAGEHFTSLSDHGEWFTGRIVYRDGKPSGLAEVEAAPILGPDGKPSAARGWFDTESLAFDGKVAYVGIERVNQILKFDRFGTEGVRARGQPMQLPPQIAKLPYNKGLESLVFVPRGQPLGGTLIALSERGLDPSGNLLAFLIGGPTPGQFTVQRRNDYDISDATLMPGGDLLLLERKFNWVEGVKIRIRRIAMGSVVPNAVVDGDALFEADLDDEVDNMEGIDVHRTPAGDTLITMISDDNFSLLQRTMLLQFRLIEP